MPRQREVAEIEVNGQRYRDWKSMSVDRRFPGIATEFAFEAASPIESASNWAGLKLAIGDEATIYLAGRKVMKGIIRGRQPAYDAQQHGLQISGSSSIGDAIEATVEANPGEYRKSSLSQVANSVLKPYGVSFKLDGDTEGADKPFDRVNMQVGEGVFTLIDRLAKMRNVFLIDDVDGNLVGFRMPKRAQSIADLEEGRNIKAASAVFNYTGSASAVKAIAQKPGNNEAFGDDARDVTAEVKNPAVTRHSPRHIICEMPGDRQDAKMRAEWEMATLVATQVSVTIVVQGWHKDDGSLWIENVGKPVTVYSPMLFTNDRLDLAIEGVNSAQGPGGTVSTLTLTLPGRLGGSGKIQGGIPQVGGGSA